MRVGIIGTGHVGLVTGACLAKLGHSVACVDSDTEVIRRLRNGEPSFLEPGLSELVAEMVSLHRLQGADSIEEAVQQSEIVFICVSTPPKADGAVDLSYIEAVARTIARSLDGYRVIVEKSTVPVKTGERIMRTIQMHAKHEAEFDVVSFPEFSREGSAIQDFLYPDRVVLGVESQRAEAMMRELVQPIDAPLLVTDIKSAELIKHASNSFLALKISYINAVANICEKVGADVKVVADGMGHDRRINRAFLDAALGYGGSCFPKDVSAFIAMAEEVGYDFSLLKEVRAVNDERKARVVAKLREALWVIEGKTIAVLGLAFKPNTDDVRGAPSLGVIDMLLAEGGSVKAYDPAAVANARKIQRDRVTYCQGPYEAADGADALAILTEWDEFCNLDMARIKKLLTTPIIVDARNVLDPGPLGELGFEYHGMGR